MLTSSLNSALSALKAAGQGLATTSNNIANYGNPNYSKFIVSFSDLTPNGVRANTPLSSRDKNLENLISSKSAEAAYLKGMSSAYNYLGSVVSTQSDGSVYNAIQTLDSYLLQYEKTPTLSQKAVVVSQLNMVISAARQTERGLAQEQSLASLSTAPYITDVNNLLSEISKLNKSISETPVESRELLINNRQELLTKLGTLTGINVTDLPSGFTVATDTGVLLISDTLAYPVSNAATLTSTGKIGAANKILTESTNAITSLREGMNYFANEVNNAFGQTVITLGAAITDMTVISSQNLNSFDNSKFSLAGITDRFTSLETTLGLSARHVESSYNSAMSTQDALFARKIMTSGVNLEDESVNMSAFRTMYEANLKMIQVADELYKTTINMVT